MDTLSELFKNKGIDFSDEENVFPRPLARICQKLSIEAYLVDGFQDDEGGRIVHSNDKFIIHVNNKHPASRSKFTIAHELGHYIKHNDLLKQEGDFLERKNNITDANLKIEAEANDFASRLIMPRDKFIEIYNIYFRKLLDIANFFGVSIDAAYYRGLNLGLIKEV